MKKKKHSKILCVVPNGDLTIVDYPEPIDFKINVNDPDFSINLERYLMRQHWLKKQLELRGYEAIDGWDE